jgi:ABC-type uncharacterized transport system substrate-binding protein
VPVFIDRGAPLQALGRRAASLAGRILRRAHPSELPVEKPTKFELIINLKTANALGHDIRIIPTARRPSD